MSFIRCLLLLQAVACTRSFIYPAMSPPAFALPVRYPLAMTRRQAVYGSRGFVLTAQISTSSPSQVEAENLGIREWPQQVKRGRWSEEGRYLHVRTAKRRFTLERHLNPRDFVSDLFTVFAAKNGQTLSRYILEGEGIVFIADDKARKETKKLRVGTLLEVKGPALLEWEATSPELIVLTPGFEEGGKFLAVAGSLIALTAALVATGSN